MTIHQLINDIPKLLAYAICIACLVQLFTIFFIHRKNIIEDLRGKDHMWQFIELSGIAWLVLFPCIVICSVLGVAIETGLWASMDTIYFMNLGGKIGYKWLENKKSNNDEKLS